MYPDSYQERKELIQTKYKFKYNRPVLWDGMMDILIQNKIDHICHEAYAYVTSEADLLFMKLMSN